MVLGAQLLVLVGQIRYLAPLHLPGEVLVLEGQYKAKMAALVAAVVETMELLILLPVMVIHLL